MFSDLDRQQLRVPWTLYAGDLSNIDITPGTDIVRTVPFNCVLTSVRASAATLTAASQFVVELLRASTVVATLTSAVPYVAPVVVAATGLSIQLSEGDALTVRVRGTDADTDDAGGLVIEAVLQPLANAPST
jgi:hypothetical protein